MPGPRKKDLTPLRKGGPISVVPGKGSASAAMPDRAQISQLARQGGMNDYAKATPMAQPMVPPGPMGPLKGM